MTYKPHTQRRAEPQNMLFGIRPILETIEAGKEIDRVLIKRDLDRDAARNLEATLRLRNIPFQYVPVEKLNRLTRKNHQGVIAFASLISYADLQEILISVTEAGGVPFVLLLDKITDVRNFGAIVRSAECAGVHAIVVPQSGAAPISGDAMKTSAGALNIVPVCRTDTLQAAVKLLKINGIQIAAALETGTQTVYGADFTLPTAIIMGAEDEGISPEALRAADITVKIPLQGKIASLNVAAAATVIMFEVVRQRKK